MPAIALVANARWGPEPHELELLLPVPGDLRGVPECAAALSAGAALWTSTGVSDRRLGVPARDADGWRWHWLTATGTPVSVPLRDARQTLREAVLECAEDLSDLDVARDDGGRIAVSESERALARITLPPAMPSESVRLLQDGVRLMAAARWAIGTTGAATSASAIELRGRVLRRLERAAREAIEAALKPAG